MVARSVRGFVRRHPKIVLVVALLVLVLLCGALLGWRVLRTLDRARSQLNADRTQIEGIVQQPDQLSSTAGRAGAQRELAEVSSNADSVAASLKGSLAFRIVGVLPGASTQRHGVIQLARDVATACQSGSMLLAQVDRLASTSSGTAVSLPALRSLGHAMGSTRSTLQGLARPDGGLWFSLKSARASFNHDVDKLTATLGRDTKAMSLAEQLLGGDGPRTFLLVAENNAEMRDQGSVLSYALVTADAGFLRVGSPTTVHDLPLAHPVDVPIPPGTEKIFGGYEPTDVWQSVDATPDFQFTGRDVAAMYQEASGQTVDGVIALDVPTLASLLNLTGPVTVPGVQTAVTASNADYILLDQLYEGLSRSSSQTYRRSTLSDVASAVVQRLAFSHVDPVSLVRVLAADASGRHLLLWSRSPQNESELLSLGLGGDISSTDPTRTFHLAVENMTATKLDYFIRVSEAMNVAIDAKTNVATVKTTVTLTSDAPVDPSPSYQFGPDDINSFSPGEYIGGTYFWAPAGSTLPGSVIESGLRLTWQQLTVYPRHSTSTTFTTTIHNAVRGGAFSLRFVPQPRMTPIALRIDLSDPGQHLATPSVHSGALEETQTLTWRVKPR